MAGLLAAEVEAVFAHRLDDIAVADLGAVQREAEAVQEALQPEIGHDRGDDAAAGKLAVRRPASRDQRHDLVAVDDVAVLVGDDEPVGVAVERDADVGAMLAAPPRTWLRARSSRSRG